MESPVPAAPSDQFQADAAGPIAELAPADRPVNLTQVFADIPLGTHWKDLPPKTKAVLERVVHQKLNAYDAQWGPQPLAAKRRALQDNPTPAQKDAFNEYVRTIFSHQVPADFVATDAIKDPVILGALKDLFLAKCAISRGDSPFYGGSSRDWDGNAFQETPLPSVVALKAAEAMAHRALVRVNKDSGEGQTKIEQDIALRIKDKLASLATGSVGGQGDGGEGALTPYGRGGWGYDLNNAATKDGGDLYTHRPEEFLQQSVAYWLAPVTSRVNAGTVASGLDYNLPLNASPETIASMLGDPKTSETAKAVTLLTRWFDERLRESPDAKKTNYDFGPGEKAAMWRSYQSDSLIPYDQQPTLSSFQKTLDGFLETKTANYKSVIANALDALFPADSKVLTDAQRQQVKDAVNAEPSFGTLLDTTAKALDSATGKKTASKQFTAALEGVGTLGGLGDNAPIPKEQEAQVQAMWTQVKDYIKEHYSGGTVDIAGLLQDKIDVTSTGGAATAPGSGRINVSLRDPVGTSDLYATLVHEAKHSIDMLSGQAGSVEGSAWEGAAQHVEDTVSPKLLAEINAKDPVKSAFSQLALINSDLRLAARSEATLAVLNAPRGTDALQAARDVATKWGLTPELTEALIQRAFIGTQYLNYLGGDAQYGDLLQYLQDQVKPKNGVEIDPYVLQMYGLETAQKDQQTVDALKKVLS